MSAILNNPIVKSILKNAQSRTYTKGQIILYPNDTSSMLFIIKEGAVLMGDVDDNGNQKILHILGPDTLFPMVSFTSNAASSGWFYTTHTDTTLYLIPYSKFKEKLEKADNPSAYNDLLKQLLDEVHELLTRLANYTKTKSHTKLKAALRFLAVHHSTQRGGWKKVNFPVSHQLLADMTGLTRETVTLTLKDFQKARAIKYSAPSWVEIQEKKLTQLEV